MNISYKTRKESCEILGIHYHTLYKLAKNKEIEAVKIGSRQMYNVEKYIKDKGLKKKDKKNICYCRVSSQKQKEDLKRQIEYMKEKFPTYEIVSDIASGLNFKREGLNKIIDLAIKGEIGILVVSYKDRLARFGYELIERIIKEYSGGEIHIVNKKEEETPEEEISKDIIAIMNIYAAKMNGLKKYKIQMKEDFEKHKKLKKK